MLPVLLHKHHCEPTMGVHYPSTPYQRDLRRLDSGMTVLSRPGAVSASGRAWKVMYVTDSDSR